mgnify:CR=1 FL=1
MKPKILAENEYYHIYNRGTDKRIIFLDDADRTRFVKLLYLANGEGRGFMEPLAQMPLKEIIALFQKEKPLTSIGAYCLMPNHFHILAKEIQPNGVSRFMQKVGTSYAMYFNTKYKRTGRLFEGTFKASRVDNDNYLRYLFSYIHLNPIKLIDYGWKDEGIKDIEHARDFLSRYQHSSYLDFLGVTRPEQVILARAQFPEYFKNKREFTETIDDWLTYHQNPKSLNSQ